jgi:small subunit ribosomal protein S17
MAETQKNERKVQQGTVVSNKMDKTVIVRVDKTMRHPQYEKVISRSKKFCVHDESNALNVGDTVTIMETRPLSKKKRWRVVTS